MRSAFTTLPIRRMVLSVLLVTMSTQPVFIVGASFFQIGPEFGLGPDGLGILTAAFFLTAAVTSPGLGRWVQRVGWRRAARVNVLASGSLMLLTAPLARNVWTLGAFLVASAGVYGMANPAANTALAEVSTQGRRATLFGVKHAGIPGSTMVAGALVPAVVLSHGWRWAFVVGAVLAVVVGFIIQWPERSAARPREAEEADIGRELSVGLLVALGAASALASWAANGLGTFLVSASLDRGIDEGAAGWLLTIGSAFSIVARVTFGRITDRKGLSAGTGLLGLMSLGALVFWSMPFVSTPVFVGLVLVAFTTGWGWPGLMTYAVVNANRSSVAASSAITQAGVFVGAGIGPFVLGQVADRVSFDAMWAVVGSALAIGAALVEWIRRARRR